MLLKHRLRQQALLEEVEEVADTSDDEQAIRAVMHVDFCRGAPLDCLHACHIEVTTACQCFRKLPFCTHSELTCLNLWLTFIWAMHTDQGGAIDLAEVGEESDTDHVDDVLQRCEAISQSLRSVLGGKSVTDRVSSLDTTPMVTQEALVAACGDAAKYLKRYGQTPTKVSKFQVCADFPTAGSPC